MTQYTPVGYLPGQFVGAFEGGSIFCAWKGHPDYTLLYFFEAPNAGAGKGQCRSLLCVQFDHVVADFHEAQSLAKESWANFKREILAGKGERVLVGPRGLLRTN